MQREAFTLIKKSFCSLSRKLTFFVVCSSLSKLYKNCFETLPFQKQFILADGEDTVLEKQNLLGLAKIVKDPGYKNGQSHPMLLDTLKLGMWQADTHRWDCNLSD